MQKRIFNLCAAIVFVATIAVSRSAKAQDSCPSGGRADAVDFMTNTGTWHDWVTGQDFWTDPMGYCRASGTDGGWGYLGSEWDWIYYGSWYDDHYPNDEKLANIPTPTIQCPDGYSPFEYVNTTTNEVVNQWCQLRPQPPHTLLPEEVDAWWNVARMFFGWLLGVGPDATVYKSGSIQVYQMQQATGIQGARNAWYDKNYHHIAFEGCQNLEPLNNFSVRFGLQGFIDAGTNATQQFVGSY